MLIRPIRGTKIRLEAQWGGMGGYTAVIPYNPFDEEMEMSGYFEIKGRQYFLTPILIKGMLGRFLLSCERRKSQIHANYKDALAKEVFLEPNGWLNVDLPEESVIPFPEFTSQEKFGETE